MYHLRLKGKHYNMGIKRGKIFKKCGISFPLNLDNFQLNHGMESEKILMEFFPEVCDEIKGVCDITGTDYLKFASFMLCMGCCMYNLESNVPVEIRGCTAFAFSKDGCVIHGRNNDLPPYLRDGCKSEIYSPENGNRFNITTSSFINGEEGLNEHGLAVSMTFVMTKLTEIKPGFNSCFIVRYLLEKANNAQNALALLLKLPVASNCNILLADRSGIIFVVECTPSLKNIREAETFNTGKIACITNSFESDKMKQYDASYGNNYNASLRYNVVLESFQKYIKDNLIENTKNLLMGNYGFMCQYDNEPGFETVWSQIFDLKTLKAYRAEGDPRKKEFINDKRL